MAGNVQGYETRRASRGPKNTLLGVKPLNVLMWQRTDKNGEIHTEIGIEVAPGDVRKWPPDLWGKAQPVGAKLQRFILEKLHPEMAEKMPQQEVTRPKAVTEGPGRPERPEPPVMQSRLPRDFESEGS